MIILVSIPLSLSYQGQLYLQFVTRLLQYQLFGKLCGITSPPPCVNDYLVYKGTITYFRVIIWSKQLP